MSPLRSRTAKRFPKRSFLTGGARSAIWRLASRTRPPMAFPKRCSMGSTSWTRRSSRRRSRSRPTSIPKPKSPRSGSILASTSSRATACKSPIAKAVQHREVRIAPRLGRYAAGPPETETGAAEGGGEGDASARWSEDRPKPQWRSPGRRGIVRQRQNGFRQSAKGLGLARGSGLSIPRCGSQG